ncbi:tRNA pseudouridine synthase C [Candidatus Koribacter versatilis Ellin345]|uniref:tRNA pseudouridine synthase C n=1 Tax=Koribacter versatilis (strain Ellin345) TaxID=204669 RepID=Q1IMW6_KORVE|nr:YqcC family protein [Candidatus Koribacter versatilis]ABF41784.1 tRNA pseudouridine synthase C [Candidatus Koribacter versatilis Ellin345]
MNKHKLAEECAEAVDKIEAEMKRIGYWQEAPLREEQYGFQQAFAMDTMTYAQWLQFAFLPRVREAITSQQFPKSSDVGTQAIREFDGDINASGLVTRLCDFDALFS